MEVLVGTFLMLLVFLGIFVSYQLGMKLINQNKNRVVAVSVASGELEQIENLPYGDVGTDESGCYPCGDLEKTKTRTFNGVDYTIETRIDYVVDSADGISEPEDSCPNDYKKVEVKISWSGLLGGEVEIIRDIFPANLAEECSETGGVLSVSVFDAFGIMINSPLIEIRNSTTEELITSATPDSGEHFFSLPATTYKIVVSKSGLTSRRTYGIEEIADPDFPHAIVLEGGFVQKSFSIDKVSSFSVDTLSPWGMDYFFDSFTNESKVSDHSNVSIAGGRVTLQAPVSGSATSIPVAPSDLIQWEEFSFEDERPGSSEIRYQFLYNDGESWVLISDLDLPGNSSGFAISPVDLSDLPYPGIEVKALLSSNDMSCLPAIDSWQISWKNSQALPISSVPFHLQGEKTIGKDVAEEFVYNYSEDLISNSAGHIDINNLEWDNYTFSVNPSSSLDLISVEPEQPIALAPDSILSVALYLQAQNSLLITIKDAETAEPIFSANCRLYGASYDEAQQTNELGQTYFIPLQSAVYGLEVDVLGYNIYSGSINVSGDKITIINLTRAE